MNGSPVWREQGSLGVVAIRMTCDASWSTWRTGGSSWNAALPPSTAYLFGAGHVSRKVATLAEMAIVRVVVLDDRAKFANRERFPASAEVVVLDSFDRCFSGLEIDNDSYVVIVTRDHLHDGTVLAQSLGTKARYIGMMGSRRKRDELFKAFVKDGFGEEEPKRIHCPIGLEIKAETQVEIAFSIVSQLFWNGLSRRKHREYNK